ncbi:MAG: DNA polymerase Y family protein [Pseudomonadota bacterium]
MRRRLIVVALPHLAAEERLRREGLTGLTAPFALAGQEGGALRLVSMTAAGAAAGLAHGMTLADARAILPSLVTRPAAPERLDAFLGALTRWATRFSPLIGRDLSAEEALSPPPAAAMGAAPRVTGGALVIDATGTAHLFGGETAMLERITEGLAALGLTARAAIADSRGAAWALAHYGEGCHLLAAPGASRAAIGDLPPAALRLDAKAAAALSAVGLARIGEMAGLARGQLARRFGLAVMTRLDQALGQEPEPISPMRAAPVIAARLTLPEPVGLVSDIVAGLDRLLERVCARLEAAGHGARALRLTVRRVDGADVSTGIQLARALRDPIRLRALFEPKIAEIHAGYGIDALRLVAVETEALTHAQAPISAAPGPAARAARQDADLADLLTRLGNRVGFENVTRLVPADSHIPERAFSVAAAGWSAEGDWHEARYAAAPPRPLILFPPEPVTPLDGGADQPDAAARPPRRFRWRRRDLTIATIAGPERLAPEWWWDDPAWSTGPRDYWRVATAEGPRLWLFHTPAANTAGPRWFVHGEFA